MKGVWNCSLWFMSLPSVKTWREGTYLIYKTEADPGSVKRGGGGGRESKFLDAAPKNNKNRQKKKKNRPKKRGGGPRPIRIRHRKTTYFFVTVIYWFKSDAIVFAEVQIYFIIRLNSIILKVVNPILQSQMWDWIKIMVCRSRYQ